MDQVLGAAAALGAATLLHQSVAYCRNRIRQLQHERDLLQAAIVTANTDNQQLQQERDQLQVELGSLLSEIRRRERHPAMASSSRSGGEHTRTPAIAPLSAPDVEAAALEMLNVE